MNLEAKDLITIIGWPTTTLLAYVLGLRSQKIQRGHAVANAVKTRRREFLAFIAKIECEIQNVTPEQCYNYYEATLPNIIREASLVAEDLKPADKVEFLKLVSILKDKECNPGFHPARFSFFKLKLEETGEFVRKQIENL